MKDLKSKYIETERLMLCVPKKEDQYDLWKIVKQESIWRYYMTIPERFNKDKKAFQESLDNWEKQKVFFENKVNRLDKDSDRFTWTIKLKDGTILGQMTVQPKSGYSSDSEVRDIGWYIDPNYQGNGYAYEAAKNILDYMFNEVEIACILTSANVINPASWKLMEKLGFIRIGEGISSHLDDNGNPLSCYIYKLTRKMYLNNEPIVKRI